MKAMILAAGLGTRLRPVTEKFAKPAVPFLNIPLLYYPITLLEEAGLHHLVINSHHKPEQIERLVQSVPGFRGQISLSHEPGTPLGSGGGVWQARSYLKGSGDFLLSNGDEVILPREPGVMRRLLEDHQASGAIATILVMHHTLVGTQFGGVWATADGDVRGFGKDPTKFPHTKGYHYIGIQVLSERVFDYLPRGESNILYDALTAAIAKGETVRVVVSDFTWFETGNPHDFLEATRTSMNLLNERPGSSMDRDFLEKICRRFWSDSDSRPSFWRGHSSQIDSSALATDSLILAGSNCVVDRGARLSGFVVLGDNAHVTAGAVVENSVVLPHSIVTSDHVVQNSIVLP